MEPATINENVVTFDNKCNITLNVNNSIRICQDENYINGDKYNKRDPLYPTPEFPVPADML